MLNICKCKANITKIQSPAKNSRTTKTREVTGHILGKSENFDKPLVNKRAILT